jgi:hypothetical protein
MQEVAQYRGDADVAGSSTETECQPQRAGMFIVEEVTISWISRPEGVRPRD